jgi:hypothetical protein
MVNMSTKAMIGGIGKDRAEDADGLYGVSPPPSSVAATSSHFTINEAALKVAEMA